jgi:hypothetical protein
MSCYRWFLRRIENPVEVCDLCGTIVSKNQNGICKKCKDLLDLQTKTPKRIQNIESKFNPILSVLSKFKNKDEAAIYLDDMFKSKQKKFLDVLLNRFYKHKTLEEIGQQYSNTREYIRQCEDKAIEIISKKSCILPYLFEDFNDKLEE